MALGPGCSEPILGQVEMKSEYLPTSLKFLSCKVSCNIDTDDLPCSYWPMGHIIDVYLGPDGVVRFSKIESKKGRIYTTFCIALFVGGR